MDATEDKLEMGVRKDSILLFTVNFHQGIILSQSWADTCCLCQPRRHSANTDISVNPQVVAGSPNKLSLCWLRTASVGALQGGGQVGGKQMGQGEGRSEQPDRASRCLPWDKGITFHPRVSIRF